MDSNGITSVGDRSDLADIEETSNEQGVPNGERRGKKVARHNVLTCKSTT